MKAANRLRRTTLADDAYGVVREILLEGGRFRPGDKISVEDLSRELGVSRSPIWAAVARLEADGLLQVVPRQGVFLKRFEAEAVLALFQAREALEGMAARLMAARFDPGQGATLAALVARQAACLEQGDGPGLAVVAAEFHQEIARGGGNPVIERALASIHGQLQCVDVQPAVESRLDNCRDHQALVSALEAGDPNRAEAITRLHVRRLATLAMHALDRPDLAPPSGPGVWGPRPQPG